MFVLAEIKDTVRIPPWQFNVKLTDAVVEALNKKLANKVVHNVGLCIALWDITKLEDSYILPGDGSSHTVVHFRYVVFRPFNDEVVIGKIKSSSKEGVH
ncbi:DNA-directed RNA polymerase III subunit RPC8-like, partial [Lingula anatina]|uniref:DNA-directed RNA polymerase III subunit RPC8-like n=1 Tax=Lingula anatina TaxID=7574 RepID=A0A1S3IGA8_LINAN